MDALETKKPPLVGGGEESERGSYSVANSIESIAQPVTYITVLTNQKPVNKHFFLNADGKLESKSATFFEGTARCVRVDGLEDVQALINGLNPNQCIVLGYHAGAPVDEEYTILTVNNLNQLIKSKAVEPVSESNGVFHRFTDSATRTGLVTTRTKDKMVQSKVILFDYDGFGAEELGITDFDSFSEHMAKIFPDFNECEAFVVPSSSSKIVANDRDAGAGGNNAKFHCYMMVEDATDLTDLSYRVLTTATEAGLGGYIESKGGAPLPRCIVDCSVFSPERIIYEADPTTDSLDHHIVESKGEIYEGS